MPSLLSMPPSSAGDLGYQGAGGVASRPDQEYQKYAN
jgi:hypothetical protein